MLSLIISVILLCTIVISTLAWYFSNTLGRKLIDYYLNSYEQVQRRLIDYQNKTSSAIKKKK